MSDPNYTLQLKDENRDLKAELEALKTDNQLLREQIRVGDVAFNWQRSELQCSSDILSDCKEVLNEVVAHGNCDCNIPNGHTCITCECALLCKRIDSITTIPNELEALRERVKEAEWIIGPINWDQPMRPTIQEWIQRRDKWLEGVKK